MAKKCIRSVQVDEMEHAVDRVLTVARSGQSG